MTKKTSSASSKSAKQTISYSTFDVSKLVVLDLQDNKMNTAQKLAMMRYKQDQYNESLLQLQTHNIKLNTYGIPKAGPYYANDKARAFIKVPEDVNDPKSVAFFTAMRSLDTHFLSKEIKTKLFGSEKVAALYKYQPIVRKAAEVDEENEVQVQNRNKYGPSPDYIKVKLDLDWETSVIKTKFFVKDEAGKRVPADDVKSVEDAARYARWKSSICIVMLANKLYASKNKVNGDSKIYGITWKAMQIVCEPPANGSTNDEDEDAFLDNDDVGSKQMSSIKITPENDDNLYQSSVSVKVNSNKGLDLDEEDDEDEDLEASPTPTPNLKTAVKATVQEPESEEEEDDEEEEEPTPPPVVVKAPARKGKSTK